MNMILNDPGPPLTVADLKTFEQEIGGQLPDDYKRFLLASNGGMAEPPLGLLWNGELHEVPGFDSLLSASETGLRGALQNLRDLQVEVFLPVASTSKQDDICIAFRGNVGTVSLALIAYDDDDAVGASMVPLANSFAELLDKLVVIPKVYCPIEELGEKGTPDDLAAYLAERNSLDALGTNGLSILCEAINFDNLPIINACIERSASLCQSISIATYNKRPDPIKLLSEAGADVNEQDEYGRRPLANVVARNSQAPKVLSIEKCEIYL
jgi:hypothetical protein